MKKNSRRAVIWDMDGVIADTADLHYRSWHYAFEKRNVLFTREDFNRNFGRRNDVTIRGMLGETIPQIDIDAIESDKEEYFRADARNKLHPFPGVISLLKTIAGSGIASAVASSAPLENIQLILNELGIQNCFQAVVYGKEVKEGKPNPQVFLTAAEKLNVKPENCIVIEDAVAGVKAAKAAGMHCIAVANSHPAPRLVEADMVVDSLVLVGIDDLNNLFGEKGVEMERTLVLVKPDAMERNLGGQILARMEKAGLKIVALKMLKVDNALANKHYGVHAGKPFFKDLIEYITSYPIIAAVFQGDNAVETARNTMGATDPKKADAGTIRKDFGLDIQRNSVHGSDSKENAEIEINLYFKKNEILDR